MTIAQILVDPGAKTLAACPATTIDTSNWVRNRSKIAPCTYLLPPGSTEQGIDDYSPPPSKRQTYYLPGITPNRPSEAEFYSQQISPILPPPINLTVTVDTEASLSCTEMVSGLTATVLLLRRQNSTGYGGNFALDLQPNIRLMFLAVWEDDPRIPKITLAILRSIIPG
jgi:hypothetical protein